MIKVLCLFFSFFPFYIFANEINFQKLNLNLIDYNQPLIIKKEDRIARERYDSYAGVGFCNKTTRFTSVADLQNITDAMNVMFAPLFSSVNISGNVFTPVETKSIITKELDLRKWQDAVSIGDFNSYLSSDFVFSQLPYNGTKILSRFIGYWNVKAPMEGTIGLNSDDGALIILGNQPFIYSAGLAPGKRLTRKYKFESSGLYPLYIFYYQNLNSAYLEVSDLLGEPTNNNFMFGETDIPLNLLENTTEINEDGSYAKMAIFGRQNIYTTIVGPTPYTCEMCSNDGDCTAGNKCLHGLCQNIKQVCTTTDFCGDDCQACPAESHACIDGKCIECNQDVSCSVNQICKNNKCIPKPPECTQDSDCKYAWSTIEYVCNKTLLKCELKKPECSINADCKDNQICNLQNKCQDKTENTVYSCDNDENCTLMQYCNSTSKVCINLPQNGCRTQLQCLQNYTCDTAAHLCIENKDNKTDDSTEQKPKAIENKGCNQSSLNGSINILLVAFIIFYKKIKHLTIFI